ncbi:MULTISPECIES: DUF4238 domain-containing protein [Sphingomonas]|uniref:DUF4238 domain-containing protein n=1 Tax=Sphingomonas TaxID=13687 RepID=UPI000F7F8792|nr:DUF4238 domain-containing protein [Sphingomonas sp. ABOLF]RSV14619.1 DUF4238 domain-containing protein [Sphingomonas sp. ABOLF]GLK19219.1 hypothetical protein GCM10017606_00450 [Microbacterium terregens]
MVSRGSPATPAKHHYVPEFYLREWAGADGKLERYTKPHVAKIMVKRVFPSETGFEKHLYSSPDDKRLGMAWLETRVFQRIDDLAAPVLRKLNATPVLNLSDEERSAWSVFVRALFYRTPATLRAVKHSGAYDWRRAIESLGERYPAMKNPDDPATLEEYIARHSVSDIESAVLRVLPSIFVGERVGQILNDLHFRVIVIPPEVPSFLISDDFVVRTNGIAVPGGHFAIPISPRRVVVMAWEKSKLEEITALPPRYLVTQVNQWVAGSARCFVGAVDRAQDRFIRNRFGTDLKNPLSRREEGNS